MQIELTYIDDLVGFAESNYKKCALLYADFNVINHLYKIKYHFSNSDILFYPDSTAVFIALNRIAKIKTTKLISTDLLDNSLFQINKKKRKVFYFGDSDDVLAKLIDKIKMHFPQIEVSGSYNGYFFDTNEVIRQINTSGAEILFVGLGVGKQENWIIDNFGKLNIKLIISCGGWFQFISGMKKRAPKILREIHLEWMYKLITQFSRIWKRYLLGVPIFFYRVITNNISFDTINTKAE
jgi:N-acetylglucosaminyldiphosphoundecaprenol N-acetyl-beta-D-mannosaminyltransferase